MEDYQYVSAYEPEEKIRQFKVIVIEFFSVYKSVRKKGKRNNMNPYKE